MMGQHIFLNEDTDVQYTLNTSLWYTKIYLKKFFRKYFCRNHRLFTKCNIPKIQNLLIFKDNIYIFPIGTQGDISKFMLFKFFLS